MKLNGETVDAKDAEAVAATGIEATSRPEFEIEGDDLEQARAVLDNLVESCFYVEDKMAERGRGSD
jgi:phosphotransferase system HPr-like phosphotransfer protein